MSKKIFYLLLASACIALLASCYGSKKASWQLDKAHAKYPAITAQKTADWYPCVTTDSSTDIEFSLADDSTQFFKDKSDSLLQVKRQTKDSLAIRYKDSCRSVQENYEQGFRLGYEVGVYDGKQICAPDTIKITTTLKIRDDAQLGKLQGKIDDLTKKNTTKTLWSKIFLIAGAIGWLIALILFLIIRKHKDDGNTRTGSEKIRAA